MATTSVYIIFNLNLLFSKIYLFKWAKVLLALEQSVNPKDRLKYQKRYTHLLNTGERALVVRWKQSVGIILLRY